MRRLVKDIFKIILSSSRKVISKRSAAGFETFGKSAISFKTRATAFALRSRFCYFRQICHLWQSLVTSCREHPTISPISSCPGMRKQREIIRKSRNKREIPVGNFSRWIKGARTDLTSGKIARSWEGYCKDNGKASW